MSNRDTGTYRVPRKTLRSIIVARNPPTAPAVVNVIKQPVYHKLIYSQFQSTPHQTQGSGQSRRWGRVDWTFQWGYNKHLPNRSMTTSVISLQLCGRRTKFRKFWAGRKQTLTFDCNRTVRDRANSPTKFSPSEQMSEYATDRWIY